MNALLIGGLSPRNKEWIDEVAAAFKPLFDQVIAHNHAHWQTGGDIDMEHELATVADEAKKLGQYIIFAKSIGTILAMRGMRSGTLAPQSCLFVGLPLELATKEAAWLPAWLGANQIPITLAQNSQDPAGSFAQVRAYLQDKAPTWRIVELPGDTHSYDDLAALQALLPNQ